jgi:hypothetical protein
MSSSNDISGAQPLVLVVGAHGALGTLVADAVHRRGWALRRSSRDPSRSPGFHHVDLNDPATLPPALDGVDVVITTVPDPALAAERYVLEHGGVLLNLSAEPAAALRTLRRDAGQPKGTVVMNAGIAPGVTNLVAAQLLGDNTGCGQHGLRVPAASATLGTRDSRPLACPAPAIRRSGKRRIDRSGGVCDTVVTAGGQPRDIRRTVRGMREAGCCTAAVNSRGRHNAG